MIYFILNLGTQVIVHVYINEQTLFSKNIHIYYPIFYTSVNRNTY